MISVRFFPAVEMINISSTAISDYIWLLVFGGTAALGAGVMLSICLMSPPLDHLIDGHVLAERESDEELRQYGKKLIAA